MSTKTTFKRVALVAVAALGLGVLTSVAPASAAEVSASPIALTAPTSPSVGVAASVTVKATNQLLANTNTVTLKGYLLSKPAGASNLLAATAGTAITNAGFTKTDGSVASLILTATGAVLAAKNTFGTFDYTATVTGDYTLRVWNDVNADGALSLAEDYSDVTFSIAAANTAVSAGYSTIEAWSVDNPVGIKTPGTALAGADADVNITVKNSSNVALYGQIIRAVVSGPGYASLEGGTPGRDVNVTLGAADNIATLALTADGIAGKQTVSIYAGGVLIGTTVAAIWYGDLATITVTQNSTIVPTLGGTAGNLGTDIYAAQVVGADAAGNVYPLIAATLAGASSDTLVIATHATAETDVDVAGGVGVVVTSAAGSTSGKTATMTYSYTYTNLAGVSTKISAAPVTYTLGGVAKTLGFALDQTSYAPGAKVTLTITAKDASGNAAADGTVFAINKLTSNVASQALPNAAVVATVNGTATLTVYAPVSSGDWVISGTDPSLATVSVSAVVANAETAAAADAAAEATDAANAATDAANAAAEAADAATAAAQDAADAVAALSAQVASLISGLKAQLTSLTNLVIKIQKKVKA